MSLAPILRADGEQVKVFKTRQIRLQNRRILEQLLTKVKQDQQPCLACHVPEPVPGLLRLRA